MVNLKTYKNGLRLVVEEMPSFESVTINFYITKGSQHENDNNRGISHLIEHMMFKGTKTKTAKEISLSFDEIGAQVNASTAYDRTIYYSHSVAGYTERCFEILSDMIFDSIFPDIELEKEKKVICEEIKMYEDDPDYVTADLINKLFYKNTPIEQGIAGTIESVLKITKSDIISYLKKNYNSENMIISFAGNISFEEAENIILKYLKKYIDFSEKKDVLVSDISENELNPESGFISKYKDNHQACVLITMKAPNIGHKMEYASRIMSTIMGTGMSSKLFERIREELGLVYSVYDYIEYTSFGACYGIGFTTSKETMEIATKEVKILINKIAENGFTHKEIEKAKILLINSFRLSIESTSYIATINATYLHKLGKLISRETLIESIENVKLEDVNALAKEIFVKSPVIIASCNKEPEIDLLKSYNNK